jgi:folate-dependent phosphoribosylglycinamide formyltransferase PurN
MLETPRSRMLARLLPSPTQMGLPRASAPHPLQRARLSRARVPPSGGSRRVSILRTAFLGTSDFAAAVLERLAASDHRPSLVLSRPDRPRGRGRRMAAPPVAERARALEIALEQPERVNEPQVVARIAQSRPDVLIVCAFGALISEPLLTAQEILNVHPSLLPRWRGAAPIERAIMAGDERTGVSIMRLTAGLDSGPVCLTATEPITLKDTYGSLAAGLWEIGWRDICREDRPRGSSARPLQAGERARARRACAASAHRCTSRACGRGTAGGSPCVHCGGENKGGNAHGCRGSTLIRSL